MAILDLYLNCQTKDLKQAESPRERVNREWLDINSSGLSRMAGF